MKNRSIGIAALLSAAMGTAYGQLPTPPGAPAIVEVVGCLSQTGSNWTLVNASAPATVTTTFTTPEAIKAAAEKPLGAQQYRLLGASPFSPSTHKGHKVVVKGLLIKNGNDTRINLTSFQMLADTCAK